MPEPRPDCGRASGSGWLLPLYPTLLAAAYVFNAWSDSAVSPFAAFRSFAITIVVAGGISAVTWITTGPNRHAALAFLGLAVIVLSGEPQRLALAGRLELWQRLVWWALLAATSVGALRIFWKIVRANGWTRVTRGLNAFSAILLLAVLLTSITSGSVAAASGELRQGGGVDDLRPTEGASDPAPDIFVLLLDGYPRADTLAEIYGFDNTPFLDSLHERGFEVSSGSRSNYMFTQLTLLSMFNLAPVEEIKLNPPLDTQNQINRAIRHAINSGGAVRVLHDHRYQLVASSPGYESVVLRQADVYLDSGEANEFERHLLRRTMLIDILSAGAHDWLPQQYRDRIDANFDHVRVLAGTLGGPRFVFIHVPAPHPPIVFRADGSGLPAPDLRALFGDTPALRKVSRAEFIDQVVGEVSLVNRRTLEAVDEILATGSDPSVILVMSDHGTRMDVTFGDPTDPEIDERFRNLFAAYTPGRQDLFGDGVTPVNVLPILFNAYLGTDLPCWPDQTWANGPINMLDLHPHPNPDAGTDPACGQRTPGD